MSESVVMQFENIAEDVADLAASIECTVPEYIQGLTLVILELVDAKNKAHEELAREEMV